MPGTPANDWDNLHRGWYSRGYLPHFDLPGQFQFMTFRLADSMPRQAVQQVHAAGLAGSEKFHDELERHLDLSLGSCMLRQPRVATLVQNALLYFDGQRYNMLHWVIMPNHVHTLIRVVPGFPLGRVMHSWKSFTAHKVHDLLGTSGDFWQPDYYDRAIRSEKHYYATAAYIENNPVKARLATSPELWPYGSAYARAQALLEANRRA